MENILDFVVGIKYEDFLVTLATGVQEWWMLSIGFVLGCVTNIFIYPTCHFSLILLKHSCCISHTLLTEIWMKMFFKNFNSK